MEIGDYKIKVNNEAESKEAQELFFRLGYEIGTATTGDYPAIIVAVTSVGNRSYSSRALCLNHKHHKDYIELTLPQLRDLVAKEKGLISGADALRALADGKEVEYLLNEKWYVITAMSVNLMLADNFEFRLKPHTITLNGEYSKNDLLSIISEKFKE